MHKGSIMLIAIFYSSIGLSAGAERFSLSFVGCFQHGICFIGISPPATASTCVNTNQIRFDITNPGSEAQYSAALAALMAEKTITAHLTDDCIDGFPVPLYLHAENLP